MNFYITMEVDFYRRRENMIAESKLPSGKLSHNYGKIHPFSMAKSTISMAIFNSFLFDITRG